MYRTRFSDLVRLPLIMFVFVLLAVVGGQARDFDFEVNLGGGHTDNLLRDSSQISDQFLTLNGTVNYYPLSFVQVRGTGELAYYNKTTALDNFLYGAGFTAIPISDSAGLSLFATANTTQRDYREDNPSFPTNEFSSTDYDAMVSVGYDLTPSIRLRTGWSFVLTGYGNEEVSDRRTNELLLGANVSLPGTNALDLEGGYSFGNFEYLSRLVKVPGIDTLLPRGTVNPDKAYSILSGDDLNSFYLSARLSRPIGQRTGVNLTFSYREFAHVDDNWLIYGYSTGFLSPWVSSYEGPAVMLSAKTFLFPRMIVSAGFGYWDRRYLDVVEATTEETFDPITGDPVTLTKVNPIVGSRKRNDDKRQYYLILQLPLAAGNGVRIEPSVNLDYISNGSSVNVYDYNSFSVSTVVNLLF